MTFSILIDFYLFWQILKSLKDFSSREIALKQEDLCRF